MQHSSANSKTKQSNKKHKGKTAGKRSRKRAEGGKINGKQSGPSQAAQERKVDRLNAQRQKQKNKREEIWLQRRIGSPSGPPKIVALIDLSDTSDSAALLKMCLDAADWHAQSQASPSQFNAQYLSLKTRCTYIMPSNRADLANLLEISKVADVVMLVISISDDECADIVNSIASKYLTCMRAAGLPEVICCVQGLSLLAGKRLLDARKYIQRVVDEELYVGAKIVDVSSFASLGRTLSTISGDDVSWRSIRSFLVPETANIVFDEGHNGLTLRVTGYLRGRPMNLHSLMHITGAGACCVQSIRAVDEAFPNRKTLLPALQPQDQVLYADPNRLNLAQLADGDILAGEQTWPLDEEMTGGVSASSTGAGRDRRLVPANIPVGMSEYMADWFVDEDGAWDDGDDDEEEEDDDDDEEMGVGGDSGHSAVECVDMGDDEDDDEDGDDDEDSMSINGSILQAPSAMEGALEKQRRKQAAMDDAEFPDEVDTPTDQSARLRFARYRALQSFRSSPWNCKENLPSQYSRIFQFENFSVTQKRVLQVGSHAATLQNDVELGSRKKGIPIEVGSGGGVSMEADDSSNKTHPLLVPNTEEFIATGRFVEIVLQRVPQNFIQTFQCQVPVSLFSMLPHEEKVSIVHYNIQRCPEYQGIIRSKDPLIFVSGHRTFRASPIFSEANLNSEKHKYERFLQPGRFACATVLAQISFMPSPVLVFKELENGATELVATGNLASVDPDRIILKRIILTGVPVRVRKRFAVVKYMFYDPQDVRYFKPAELITKHGLRGHIKEPIGTHGLFKAIFNAPIKQNDTVMLVLYKRVFPKSYMGIDLSGNGAP